MRRGGDLAGPSVRHRTRRTACWVAVNKAEAAYARSDLGNRCLSWRDSGALSVSLWDQTLRYCRSKLPRDASRARLWPYLVHLARELLREALCVPRLQVSRVRGRFDRPAPLFYSHTKKASLLRLRSANPHFANRPSGLSGAAHFQKHRGGVPTLTISSGLPCATRCEAESSCSSTRRGTTPWERSKHAMCRMWHEWDGMQEVVAEQRAGTV